MTISDFDFAHVIVALFALLVSAHGVGFIFQRCRQPRVIGEIFGGVLLGPTLLGRVAPDVHAAIFASNIATGVVLAATYKLGLLLLLFCSGMEIRASFAPAERRVAFWITATGTLIPFAIAMVSTHVVDLRDYYGPSATPLKFDLVLAIALAVTSIPVISRILLDLNLLDTAFARIVLSAAVIEDILLYVVLAVALPPDGGGTRFGAFHLLGLDGTSTTTLVLHVVTTLAFFAVALAFGPRFFSAVSRSRINVVRRGNSIGWLMTCLLVATLVAMFLDVNLMFGAFVAGLVAGTAAEAPEEARKSITQFSTAFFIPVYFAMVGLRLDLLNDLPVVFFVLFLAAACIIKALSVFLGARIAGQSRHGCWNLAVAMNARGGPGIVLASLARDARVIDQRMFTVFVLLAIVTSMLAGSWLTRQKDRGADLL